MDRSRVARGFRGAVMVSVVVMIAEGDQTWKKDVKDECPKGWGLTRGRQPATETGIPESSRG